MSSNSIIILSLFLILGISCELDKDNSKLSIPDLEIEKIVIGLSPDEISITDKSTINEVVQILKKAYKPEISEISKSDYENVRIQLITTNPKDGKLYLLDKKNGYINILTMKKTTKFKIDEIEKLNDLLKYSL